MFLIRAAFWIGLVVLLLPTDEKSQARLINQAQAALHWTWTFCDRNGPTCKAGSEAWATFVRKAEFGFALATGMVQEWSEKSAGQATGSPIAPAVDPVSRSPMTAPRLKHEDAAPAWRGGTRTGV
jgi:hypothetical protein